MAKPLPIEYYKDPECPDAPDKWVDDTPMWICRNTGCPHGIDALFRGDFATGPKGARYQHCRDCVRAKRKTTTRKKKRVKVDASSHVKKLELCVDLMGKGWTAADLDRVVQLMIICETEG